MRRGLYTILPSLYLLLSAIVVGLWITSYVRSDCFAFTRQSVGLTSSDSVSWQLRSGGGRIAVLFIHRQQSASGIHIRQSSRSALSFSHHKSPPADPIPHQYSVIGFTFGSGVAEPPPKGVAADDMFLAIPYWSLLLLTAIPLFRYSRHQFRLSLRRQRGRCPSCGYDLRATPERCPECGREAEIPVA